MSFKSVKLGNPSILYPERRWYRSNRNMLLPIGHLTTQKTNVDQGEITHDDKTSNYEDEDSVLLDHTIHEVTDGGDTPYVSGDALSGN